MFEYSQIVTVKINSLKWHLNFFGIANNEIKWIAHHELYIVHYRSKILFCKLAYRASHNDHNRHRGSTTCKLYISSNKPSNSLFINSYTIHIIILLFFFVLFVGLTTRDCSSKNLHSMDFYVRPACA